MPTRRAMLRRGLAAGGATVLAGCGQSADDPIPGFDPDGRVLTTLVRGASGTSQLNPYSLNQTGGAAVEPFQQLVLPADAPTGAFRTSGHAWTVDGEEVTVPCAVTDFSVDDEGVTTTFESGLTYWNGDALDAAAYYRANRVDWLAFGEFGAPFPNEVVDATTYRRPVDTETWADVRDAVHPGPPPLPPAFTRQWIQRFENASSREARDGVYGDLNASQVTLDAFVSQGYGSGAYRVESTDAISRQGIGAVRRDDHPGDVAVPNLIVRTPRNDGAEIVGDGNIDVGTGHVAARGGDYQRSVVPESVRQLRRYPSPVTGGFQLVFNWDSTHLRRLWVRRGLAAAVPMDQVVANVYGKSGRPLDQHSGLLSHVASARLGRDFVDSLVSYPVEADPETAGEWLRNAGYARQDGRWYDPDGNPLSLTLVAGGRARAVDTSVESGLADVGVDVTVETRSLRPSNRFESAIHDGEYDLTVGFVPSGLTAADHFAVEPSFAGPRAVCSPLAVGGGVLGRCEPGADWHSPPGTVTVPSDPGALWVDGVTYPDGGTTYQHDGGVDVDVCEAIHAVRAPDSSDGDRRAAARRCARWYNYALPTVLLGQVQIGLFGNTESFAFPDDDGALRTARPPSWSPAQYHVQAGTIR